MPDAIDNLVQDLSQVGVSPYEYPILTDEGYVNTIPNPNFVEPYAYPNPPRFGLPEQPAGMFDPVLDYGTRQWLDRRMRSPNPTPQDLSNPSTLATGGEIDYNIPDDPTIRTNIGNTDEKDAFVRTGIGTTLDPKTEDFYGVKGLVSPDQAGGFVGVEYLTPKQIEDLTAGQTGSVPQGVRSGGGTALIKGEGLPDYRQLINDDGTISYLNKETGKIDFTVPSFPGYPNVPDLRGNPNLRLPFIQTQGTGASLGSTPFTPTSVGAVEPSTTSEGGFDNTGGNVTAGPGGAKDITPDWKEEVNQKPKVENDIDGDGISDVWRIATGGNWRFDTEGKWSNVNPDYIDPRTDIEYPPNQTGDRWNFTKGDWDYAPVKDTGTTPGKDTGTTTTPPGGGTTTTPPSGGTTTTPPGGGTPSGGGQPGRGPTIIPPREPVTPLVRREVVIPTKGTKEVPLPDRQADPFAKLYADLLANAQQQEDRYRYINYDPDQIMNAAMSGFRRRGAMRSLQG